MKATDLDQLPTADLQHRAFALARERRDWRFFIELFRHTPTALDSEDLDPDVAEIGVAIDDLLGMWREATKGDWGSAEPLARAAFIDYILKHGSESEGPKD
ncbi:hypothetical protein K3N28_01200 [Glycomyces sp. TRM65418]|uniref:hypothetical protein n=1 Tax=Glycomyces sp. TRM65418 TaxID=2867006 RepID=UPI001CE6898C|nr:hypothetical protein [Glycomyces sp. TRM65418]MCC3761690.1 hypothetical protein [Glycomyces sp. TRM65418]QZD55783.1 hypothetical protein K3N28_01190 [Glycomyces sp. TRM65418]